MPGSSARAKDPRAAGTEKMQAVAAEAARENEAASLLDAASDILENQGTDLIHGQPAIDAAALWMLHAAVTGTSNGKALNGADRKALFDSAMTTLTPAMSFYAQDDDQRAWVEERITPHLDELRTELDVEQAEERVRGAMVLPGGHVVDPNDDTHPHEQAEALHEAIPKLVETVMQLNEMIVTLHEKEIEKHIEHMLEGIAPEGSTKIGSLVELANVLSVISGYLILTDEELAEHLRNAPGGLSRVRSAGELVKGVVEFTGGALGVVTSGIGLVARAAGEPEMARVCAGFARGLGLTVGMVVAAIETLRGLATLADPDASREQKIEAGVDIATLGVPLALKIKDIEAIRGISVGPAVVAMQLGIGELKLALHAYWGAAQGLEAGMMVPAFKTLKSHADALAGLSDEVLKAETLHDRELDAAQKTALAQVLAMNVRQLGGEIDSLLADLAPPDLEAGMARQPGAYQILGDALAPVQAFRGAREKETVVLGATVALRCLEFVFANKEAIIDAAASHRGLSAVVAHAAAKKESEP
jgi:hypothetical protein